MSAPALKYLCSPDSFLSVKMPSSANCSDCGGNPGSAVMSQDVYDRVGVGDVDGGQ